MHAVVWSQPIVRRKLRRCPSRPETPASPAGKLVLGVGIAMTMSGGLLSVLGLTGYFVRGGNKYYLGFGVIVGVMAVVTGLTGTRSVSRRSKAKMFVLLFTFLAILSVGASVTMVVLGSLVLSSDARLLLTTVIAVGETTLSLLVFGLASAGAFMAIYARTILLNPSLMCGTDIRTVSQTADRYHIPVRENDFRTHEAAMSLVSNREQRV